jgi:hypothetical protein
VKICRKRFTVKTLASSHFPDRHFLTCIGQSQSFAKTAQLMQQRLGCIALRLRARARLRAAV